MSRIPRATAQTKANAAESSKRANALARTRDKVLDFFERRGRSPNRPECEALGIWFGGRNVYPNLEALLLDCCLPMPQRVAWNAGRGSRERAAALQPKLDARAMESTHRTRRCEACLQVCSWSPDDTDCPHCHAPWVRRAA